ncbi:MAG: hypothetical protein ABR600_01810 [Actinomycetota bacterium]
MNRYAVAVSDGSGGWRVAILDPSGAEVFERACSDEAEARAFASTVEQHVGWLSEERLRRYYRLP